jgi:hypothetical protein
VTGPKSASDSGYHLLQASGSNAVGDANEQDLLENGSSKGILHKEVPTMLQSNHTPEHKMLLTLPSSLVNSK